MRDFDHAPGRKGPEPVDGDMRGPDTNVNIPRRMPVKYTMALKFTYG